MLSSYSRKFFVNEIEIIFWLYFSKKLSNIQRIFCIYELVASVAQRKWTRPKTMRSLVRIPVTNFEIWKCVFEWEKQCPIVFIALRSPEPAPTPSSDICERHTLVTWYQNGGKLKELKWNPQIPLKLYFWKLIMQAFEK
jgi:hypothetical protein